MNKKLQIFISYSHNNSDLKKRLDTHLEALRREIDMEVWSDSKIIPGKEWYWEITNELKNSAIVLLLLSPDYIASDNCIEEMDNAVKLYASEKKCVIPVYLQTSAWDTLATIIPGKDFQKEIRITSMQGCPLDKNNRPFAVEAWEDKDAAFDQIRKSLKLTIDEIKNKINNTDIESRAEEIIAFIQIGELIQALNRLIDFVNQFTQNRELMIRANLVSGKYYTFERKLNGKRMNKTDWEIYDNIAKDINDIVYKVKEN